MAMRREPGDANGRRGHEWSARLRGDSARWGHRALPQRDRITGTGEEGDTSGAHGHGVMRRDGDIAPYRNGTGVWGAHGRGVMRRDGDIAPYRNGTVQRERAKKGTGNGNGRKGNEWCARARGDAARWGHRALPATGPNHGNGRRGHEWSAAMGAQRGYERGAREGTRLGRGDPMGEKAISVSGVGAREIRQPNRNRLLRRGYWGHRPQGECRRKALRRRGRSAARPSCRPSRCSVGALV